VPRADRPTSRAAAPRPAAATHLALLRGVNVGGKNRLPMKALADTIEEAGCRDVRTYIQSGNALFAVPAARAHGLAARLAGLIAARHGLRVPVVLRSVEALRAVVRSNPFLEGGADPATLHVAFLAEPPAPAAAAALDPGRSPPDAFALVGGELFLSLPNGVARTRLTSDYLDRTLRTTCTVRNWRTVLALVGLAGG
jgi:uncharacterized protein (DUF1697 family)